MKRVCSTLVLKTNWDTRATWVSMMCNSVVNRTYIVLAGARWKNLTHLPDFVSIFTRFNVFWPGFVHVHVIIARDYNEFSSQDQKSLCSHTEMQLGTSHMTSLLIVRPHWIFLSTIQSGKIIPSLHTWHHLSLRETAMNFHRKTRRHCALLKCSFVRHTWSHFSLWDCNEFLSQDQKSLYSHTEMQLGVCHLGIILSDWIGLCRLSVVS